MGSKLVIGKVIEAILDKDGGICGVKLEDGNAKFNNALPMRLHQLEGGSISSIFACCVFIKRENIK